MRSRGVDLGPTGRMRGRGRGREIEVVALKLVCVTPYKILYN